MDGSYKYSYKIGETETTALSVYNVGYQQCGPDGGWGPGVRDHYLIHHILSGRGVYRCPAGTFQLTAGDTFLVCPDTEVSYTPDPLDPWEYYWVGFGGADAKLLLERTALSESAPVISVDFGAELKDAFLEIYRSRGQESAALVRMTGKLYLALALLMERAPAPQEKEYGALQQIRHAQQFIDYNFSRPIGVEEIAQAVGLSRSTLYRQFMRLLSDSPKEYLTRVRLRRAADLLRETRLSVAAISHSVGFADSLYFSKAFHRWKGCSPSEYRNRKSAGFNGGDKGVKG